MNYYLLPKFNKKIYISITIKTNDEYENQPYISNTLSYYYEELNNQIKNMFNNEIDISNNTYTQLLNLVNPYSYIFSNVYGCKEPICKYSYSNLFFDLYEIIDITSIINTNEHIDILSVTPEYNEFICCIKEYNKYLYNHYNIYNNDYLQNINDKYSVKCFSNWQKIQLKRTTNGIEYNNYFIFYELDYEHIINSLVTCLMIIYSSQSYTGNIIVKMNTIFEKYLVQFIFILSSLYDEIYIMKPSTSFTTSFDKYIVCKKFKYNKENIEDKNYLEFNYTKLYDFLYGENRNVNENIGENLNICIKNLFDFEIPLYFRMKINDFNNILGQQQLETMDQIIVIYKSKNKNEKIENIKQHNIKKSCNWCEKYKMPYNKLDLESNIFLCSEEKNIFSKTINNNNIFLKNHMHDTNE